MGFTTELNDTHKAWLDMHYIDGASLADVARHFGVTHSAVSQAKSSPAGQRYAASLPLLRRGAVNLGAGNLIAERLSSQGPALPLDVLVKLYVATMPPEPRPSTLEVLLAEADHLADEHNLDESAREKLRDFAMSGGRRVSRNK